MTKQTILLSVGLLTAFTFSAGADELKLGDASKLPAPAGKAGVTWDADIKPIVEKSCGKCHGGEKPKGKFRADTKANFLKGGESGEPVVVGKSDKSAVIHMVADLVADMEMPPTDKREKYPPLTKEQIGLLRAWIDQGAK